MHVNESEYNKSVSLATEAQHVLYLLHTRDTNNKETKELPCFPPVTITSKT